MKEIPFFWISTTVYFCRRQCLTVHCCITRQAYQNTWPFWPIRLLPSVACWAIIMSHHPDYFYWRSSVQAKANLEKHHQHRPIKSRALDLTECPVMTELILSKSCREYNLESYPFRIFKCFSQILRIWESYDHKNVVWLYFLTNYIKR